MRVATYVTHVTVFIYSTHVTVFIDSTEFSSILKRKSDVEDTVLRSSLCCNVKRRSA